MSPNRFRFEHCESAFSLRAVGCCLRFVSRQTLKRNLLNLITIYVIASSSTDTSTLTNHSCHPLVANGPSFEFSIITRNKTPLLKSHSTISSSPAKLDGHYPA